MSRDVTKKPAAKEGARADSVAVAPAAGDDEPDFDFGSAGSGTLTADPGAST